jgi:hypothetical protein
LFFIGTFFWIFIKMIIQIFINVLISKLSINYLCSSGKTSLRWDVLFLNRSLDFICRYFIWDLCIYVSKWGKLQVFKIFILSFLHLLTCVYIIWATSSLPPK